MKTGKNILREYFKRQMGDWADSFSDYKLRKLAASQLEKIRPSGSSTIVASEHPIRDYFYKQIGEWVEHLDDEELDSIAIKSIEETVSNVKDVTNGFHSHNAEERIITSGYNESDLSITPYINTSTNDKIEAGDYDMELEDVVFSFPLKNGSGKRYQKYSGVLVEDKIGKNRPGMPVSGYFETIEDVNGGIIIKNGKKLYVKNMKRSDIFKEEKDKKSYTVNPSRDYVSGKFVYLFDSKVFKEQEKNIIEIADDSSYANESNDGKYIRLVVDRKKRNGVNTNYALYYCYAAINENGEIIKE